MPRDKSKVCGNCLFWDEEKKTEDGAPCKFHAPPARMAVPSNPQPKAAVWPVVPAGEWCGQYQPK